MTGGFGHVPLYTFFVKSCNGESDFGGDLLFLASFFFYLYLSGRLDFGDIVLRRWRATNKADPAALQAFIHLSRITAHACGGALRRNRIESSAFREGSKGVEWPRRDSRELEGTRRSPSRNSKSLAKKRDTSPQLLAEVVRESPKPHRSRRASLIPGRMS